MYTFSEYVEARMLPRGEYSRNYKKELLDDARDIFRMLETMTRRPPKSLTWTRWGHDHWIQPENTERMINNTFQNMLQKVSPGFSRAKSRSLMKNYMLQMWQKEPQTRKNAEFATSLGWQPAMTATHYPAASTYAQDVPQEPVGSQHYAYTPFEPQLQQDVGLWFTPRRKPQKKAQITKFVKPAPLQYGTERA